MTVDFFATHQASKIVLKFLTKVYLAKRSINFLPYLTKSYTCIVAFFFFKLNHVFSLSPLKVVPKMRNADCGIPL
ncbi:hypothetical protein BpHYR1_006434 [Brachionus plicatilis]|uniref:Uncharacterized protein n=1 Tax=Brachionus plicatilis TaxID=10195 RepID=A0A3M7SY12_BRAPC|nr:hypothetical protein BpHYR1_006434 [Brachionus plicatilis]